MALNYIQPGDAVTVIVPAGGFVSGNGYLLGTGKLVVSMDTKAQGLEAECATTGVYSLPKAAPLVIAIGDTLYWDNTAKTLSKTNTGVMAGWAFKAAASADTFVQIKLAP